MDGGKKHRFVQQYVEQQKAYIPLYATEGPPNDQHIHDTPSEPKPALRSDEFGFDTPILRPRVSKVKPAAPSPSSRRQERSADPPRPKPPPVPTKAKVPTDKEVASPNRDKVPTRLNEKRDKSTSKRRAVPAVDDTDDERAARLADRRERKRKKRTIVNPKHDEFTAPISKTKGHKAKTPAAALALMYGFSATNVTKDRLTVKPVPSLGVFSKGKASSKKSISTKKKSSKVVLVINNDTLLNDPASKKEMFSESAFLNKSSVLGSKVAGTDSSNDSSLSLVPDRPAPKKSRITKETQAPLEKDKKTPTSEALKGLGRAPAGSEIWDIELESKLPSSVPEIRSEHGAKGSASVVLDLQGAKWSASTKAAEGQNHKVSSIQDQSKGPSIIGDSSALAGSHSGDDCGLLTRDADTSTILPCHSASQVGRLVAGILPPAPRLVTSKYFTAPVPIQQEPAVIDVDPRQQISNGGWDVPHRIIQDQHIEILPHPPQISDSGLDASHRPMPEQYIQDPPSDPRGGHRVDSPITSLISLPLPVLAFRTPYDSIAPLEFSSDTPMYDDQYADAPQEPQVRPSYPQYEPQVWGAPSSDVPEFYDPGEMQDSFRPLITSYPSPGPALEYLPAEVREDGYDTQESQHDYGEEIFQDDIDCQYDTFLPAIFQPQNEDDYGESYLSEREFPVTEEDPDGMAEYDRETIDAPIYYQTGREDDNSFGESEDEVELPEFLEGRALLVGILDQRHQMTANVRLSGLHQAEMDVASQLRDHWRPVRL